MSHYRNLFFGWCQGGVIDGIRGCGEGLRFWFEELCGLVMGAQQGENMCVQLEPERDLMVVEWGFELPSFDIPLLRHVICRLVLLFLVVYVQGISTNFGLLGCVILTIFYIWKCRA